MDDIDAVADSSKPTEPCCGKEAGDDSVTEGQCEDGGQGERDAWKAEQKHAIGIAVEVVLKDAYANKAEDGGVEDSRGEALHATPWPWFAVAESEPCAEGEFTGTGGQ